jgi:uncharacterized protein YukE
MTNQDHFHVEPSSLTSYAGQITRNADYFGQIQQYMSANANKTNEMQGLLQEMASVCSNLLDWQLGILSRMQKELGDSATALNQAATSYSNEDQRNAARLDQTYSPGQPHPAGTQRPK